MADTGFASLSSARLILRRLRDSDLPTFCRYRSDPQVAQYQDWVAFPEEVGLRFFAGQAKLHPDIPGTWFQMAIELAETGELVGDCGLHPLPDQPRQVEIGFTLSPDHQDKGYATEAVACLLDYVFGRLNKHRAIAITDATNVPAARVLERVGMRREGHFLQNVWFKGGWGDEYLYALLEREWRGARDSSPAWPPAPRTSTCRGSRRP
jgi:RimJ/RimL family protein N-acetyltransferase